MFGNRDISSMTPQDWQGYRRSIAKRWNPVNTGNEVTRVKAVFNWAEDMRIFPKGLIAWGPDFHKPSRKVCRRYRRTREHKLYDREEILAILDECSPAMRLCVLLGINCAYLASDIACLPASAIEASWLDFPRPKTEIDRRCYLWRETTDAISAVRGDEELLIPLGSDGISDRFRAARDFSGIRRGGFSWLRSTFATVASRTSKQIAVNYIMGHADDSIAAVYRWDTYDEQIEEVALYVRQWLFG
jgi:integrase